MCITNLMKTYQGNQSLQYGGEKSEDFDTKFKKFKAICKITGVQDDQLEEAFPLILKEEAERFFGFDVDIKTVLSDGDNTTTGVEKLANAVKDNFITPDTQREAKMATLGIHQLTIN